MSAKFKRPQVHFNMLAFYAVMISSTLIDGELKSAGVTLGDRGKIKKADFTALSGNSQKDDLPIQNSSSSPTPSSIDKA